MVAERGRAGREAAAYVADGGEHDYSFCFCREDRARTMPVTDIVRDFLATLAWGYESGRCCGIGTLLLALPTQTASQKPGHG